MHIVCTKYIVLILLNINGLFLTLLHKLVVSLGDVCFWESVCGGVGSEFECVNVVCMSVGGVGSG